jgi:hypothetical protein
MLIINDKKQLRAWLDTCKGTQELRDVEKGDDASGGEGEWPEFRREIVKLCFDKTYLKDALGIELPPPLGSDWDPWLERNLEDIIEEAVSIVM